MANARPGPRARTYQVPTLEDLWYVNYVPTQPLPFPPPSCRFPSLVRPHHPWLKLVPRTPRHSVQQLIQHADHIADLRAVPEDVVVKVLVRYARGLRVCSCPRVPWVTTVRRAAVFHVTPPPQLGVMERLKLTYRLAEVFKATGHPSIVECVCMWGRSECVPLRYADPMSARDRSHAQVLQSRRGRRAVRPGLHQWYRTQYVIAARLT